MRCGHSLGMQYMSPEDVTQWQMFFEKVGWSLDRQQVDDDTMARIGWMLPLPGADATEPWIFCVHSQLREPVLPSPTVLPIGIVEPVENKAGSIVTKLANREVSSALGYRWLIATNKRLAMLKVYKHPLMVYQQVLPFASIKAVQCSRRRLGMPLVRSAWTIELLTQTAPKDGVRLNWVEKPLPRVELAFLKSMYLGHIGGLLGNAPEFGTIGQRVGESFDSRAESVWEKYHQKRDLGEQIMDFCEAFFIQLAPAS